EVETDLLGVDVEGGDELDVTHVVPAELHVHEPGDVLRRVSVAVVVHALHQRAGAVAHAGDGDSDGLAHWESSSVDSGPSSTAVRSAAISRSSQEMSRSVVSVPCSISERVYASSRSRLVRIELRAWARRSTRWARRRSSRPSRASGGRYRANASFRLK